MPTYDYKCQQCGQETEIFHKISDECPTTCPACQKPGLQRKFGGSIGLQFQGSGFYATDHDPKRKPASEGAKCCPCGKNSGSCSN